jgi:hypothetical protein
VAIGKKVGKKSQGSNDFLMPRTPTIGTATNVGTGRAFNNGAATVTFTADPTYAADSFTVTSTPGSFTGSGASSPITVTGLLSDTAYTFKVTATNTYGTSGESQASNSITATTVPATPSAPTASSPNADQDQISWTAPANGGSAITNYHWQSNEAPVKEGDTATTLNATVGQEAGTAQRYKVYATNANGNSEYSALSAEVTTTFSFVPFSVFGFSPFSVFGFSPFNVFGFSPFNVFGFSPFRVFGFSPTYFCIDEDAPVLTKTGNKKAKDIKLGDTLITKTFDQLPVGHFAEVIMWMGMGGLTNYRDIESTVTEIVPSVVEETVIINNNPDMRFSTMEDILTVKHNVYKFIPSREIKPGDTLVTKDSLMVVENVETVNETRTVYMFSRDPLGLVVAGNLLCYSSYALTQDYLGLPTT